MAKNYKSFTGLKDFHYKASGGSGVASVSAEGIKYLQEISVSKEQSIEKAYGDNVVAEMAVTNGTVELSATFHKLPIEDRSTLFGLKVHENGAVAIGNNTPPDVAVMFTKTMEDGSAEYVGLPRGKFTFPESSGSTKQDSVEFGQDEATGEFMQAAVAGFDEEQTMIMGHDDAGSTVMRDFIYKAVFGETHPDATPAL